MVVTKGRGVEEGRGEKGVKYMGVGTQCNIQMSITELYTWNINFINQCHSNKSNFKKENRTWIADGPDVGCKKKERVEAESTRRL